MLERVDVKGKLVDLKKRTYPIFSGMRPTIEVKPDYMTTSIIEFDDDISVNEDVDVNVCFISPKYYANCLWVGKVLNLFEGSKIIGYITVEKIINSVLDRDAEKWVLFDGRGISALDDFYEQAEVQLTKNVDFRIGHNLNAFNDLLWGGFGIHEYEETLNIIWIYAKECKDRLGEDFDVIKQTIETHENNNIKLELYDEHAFE